MKVAIISNGTGHQQEHAEALRAGFDRHAIESRIVARDAADPTEEIVACWGWRIGRWLRERGKQVLVMERGYVGDRYVWSSLAWNGLNGRGQAPEINDDSRWNRHFSDSMQPWKADGDYSLVIGQVPGDQSILGVGIDQWYRDAMRVVGQFGPVKFRPHPVAIEAGHSTVPKGADVDLLPLAESLARAKTVITWNSNTGVDAVLAGVPTITSDPGSMAWAVSGHSLEETPPTPDRSEWAHRLAWRQWRLEEIADGSAWAYIGQFV